VAEPDDFLLVPTSLTERLDLGAVFGRSAPVEADIGCGDGRFLIDRALAYPDRDFLGIERLLGRVRTVCRRAWRAGAANVRVMRIDSAYAMRYLLPAASLACAHMLFPDPWPKRRHHSRRVFNAGFAGSVCDALVPGGRLFLKTDDAHYFSAMLAAVAVEPRLVRDPTPFPEDYPVTGFERHYLAQGRHLHAARYLKIEPRTS
jgi:tRNA (guanine-N7-)-methyltransferase